MARIQPLDNLKNGEEQRILCPFCHKPNLRRARFCQHCGRDVVLNNAGPRYYITRVIKQGGQGAVYEAIDDSGHRYAVKEMLDRFADPNERHEAIRQFEHEARLLQGLSHPRIPRVYAHFKDEGRHYLAMDFVQGEDVEQIIEREERIPEPQVLEWADQICDVLTYLHSNGLIYHDMKPSNIMVDQRNGGIKLIDFGITRVFQPTQRGSQYGTPGYAPPEQYQGFARVESDIYAFGATLHHMLTGRDPRDEKPFTFPPVRDLNPEVTPRTAEAIARALEWEVEKRPRSVSELRASLRPLPQQTGQVRRAPLPNPAAQRQPVATAARTAAPTQPIPSTGALAPQPTPAAPPATTPAPRLGFVGRIRAFFSAVVRFITRLIRNLMIATVIIVIISAIFAYVFPDTAASLVPVIQNVFERSATMVQDWLSSTQTTSPP